MADTLPFKTLSSSRANPAPSSPWPHISFWSQIPPERRTARTHTHTHTKKKKKHRQINEKLHVHASLSTYSHACMLSLIQSFIHSFHSTPLHSIPFHSFHSFHSNPFIHGLVHSLISFHSIPFHSFVHSCVPAFLDLFIYSVLHLFV